MRLIAIAVFMSIIFLIPMSSATMLQFTDTDFSGGEFSSTTTDVQGGNLTLSIGSDGKYYSNGSFVSRVFDAGIVVPWKSASWTEFKNNSIHGVGISVRFSNDTISWSSWSQPSSDAQGVQLSAYSRYLQYRVNLNTTDNESTPVVEDVTILYEMLEPSVTLTAPENNFVSYDGNVTLSCSATDATGLKNITLYWDYTGSWVPNYTAYVSGVSNSSIFQKYDLRDGVYTWNCLAYNNYSIYSFGLNRTFVVNRSVVRINFSAVESVIAGSHISLLASATSVYPIDSVWTRITMPNSSAQNIVLGNGISYVYTTTIPGRYNITTFANDTRGNKANLSSSFSALPSLRFTTRPSAPLMTPSSVKTTFYFSTTGTKAYEYNVMTDSLLVVDILDGIYNIKFTAFYGGFQVKLNGVNASENLNKQIVFDSIENHEGFANVYAVETNYSYNSVEVKIFYNASKFLNDNYTGMYKCMAWDITNRVCSLPWVKISPVIDLREGSITITTMGLSAFALKQEPFCGDGFCSPDENSESCFTDCECTGGDTRTCGSSSIGVCKHGVQTCINGHWGECIGSIEPSTEVCNGRDDNCDTVIDNVDNGTSVETTKCNCFGSGMPQVEECNGIDDDCDGQVDEGIERSCGTNRGACDFGKSLCVTGRWGECMGEIKPQMEICGNSIDDNCNGEVDESCPVCTNGIMDGDEEGTDCGGSCPNECAEIPWLLIAAIGAVGLVIVFLYEFLKRIRGKREERWDELENRYVGGGGI